MDDDSSRQSVKGSISQAALGTKIHAMSKILKAIVKYVQRVREFCFPDAGNMRIIWK